MESDYTPGDAPVPVGTIVDYFGSHAHGRYEITATGAAPTVLHIYPDGRMYDLWPENTPRKFGMRHLAVYNVRRTSFQIVALSEEK
jgi:hypothetical protein